MASSREKKKKSLRSETGASGEASQARYVAIITDGNGRWAQERGLPVNEGH
jgi:undecaprenyl pyrophosphate synthase